MLRIRDEQYSLFPIFFKQFFLAHYLATVHDGDFRLEKQGQICKLEKTGANVQLELKMRAVMQLSLVCFVFSVFFSLFMRNVRLIPFPDTEHNAAQGIHLGLGISMFSF
jgi:hypothetical protein